MYKIVICCQADVTSNMLVSKIKDVAKQEGITVMVWSVSEHAIQLSGNDADCIFVAPQSYCAIPQIKKVVKDSMPVEKIPEDLFVAMDAKALLEKAISHIERK